MKKMKIFGLILLLSVIVILSGCIGSQKTQDIQYNGKNQEPTATPSVIVTKSDNKITVGTFNIHKFNTEKASTPEIMGVLSKIVRNFDVIALQEINDRPQTALPMLRDAVNSIGRSQYEYVVGRTTSIEQYAYFYNTQTIKLMGSPYLYNDSNSIFKIDPYVEQFKVKKNNFDFVLINIHTNPDRATHEIKDLPKVVEDTKSRYQGESDIIIIGDLNADCNHSNANSPSPLRTSDYYWLINNSVDTTTIESTNCTYDRIIITTPTLPDFTGKSGVFRFDAAYNLSYNSTIAVSDHYPVYAEFWGNRDIDRK
jgi:endonuclease/exonuclease/phosphatase family metal-dependent hydrolase